MPDRVLQSHTPGVLSEGVNESSDCDLTCSRGLQPAFGSWEMSKLSASERGLKPATTYSDRSELIHSHLPRVPLPSASYHDRILDKALSMHSCLDKEEPLVQRERLSETRRYVF
jgi:hypothetical protein